MKAANITFTAEIVGEGTILEFGFDQIGNRYIDDDVFYVTNQTGEPIACSYSSIEIKLPEPPQLPAAARQYLIDAIDILYPADAEYDDTRAIGQRLLTDAMYSWMYRRLPGDWREMPDEVLEEYAQACARMEFRDYSEAESDYSKWWNGYKEAKQQHP